MSARAVAHAFVSRTPSLTGHSSRAGDLDPVSGRHGQRLMRMATARGPSCGAIGLDIHGRCTQHPARDSRRSVTIGSPLDATGHRVRLRLLSGCRLATACRRSLLPVAGRSGRLNRCPRSDCSRRRGQPLPDGEAPGSVDTGRAMAGLEGPGSVDTSSVMAGFGGHSFGLCRCLIQV